MDGWMDERLGWMRLREGRGNGMRHHRQCNGEQTTTGKLRCGAAAAALANDNDDDVDDDGDDDDDDDADGGGRRAARPRPPAPALVSLVSLVAWPACRLFVGPSAFCHLQPKRRVTRTI